MRNLFLMCAVALCIPLISLDSAEAGDGGGKKSKSARVQIQNADPAVGGIDLAVWIRPVGTPFPTTVGGVKRQLIFIGVGEMRNSAKLKNGRYSIALVPAAVNQLPDNTPTSSVVGQVIADQEFSINGVDRLVDVRSTGQTINFVR